MRGLRHHRDRPHRRAVECQPRRGYQPLTRLASRPVIVMRLLLLLAVVFFVIALVCFLVPTAVAGASGLAWLTGGLLTWALDALLGGWVAPLGVRQGP